MYINNFICVDSVWYKRSGILQAGGDTELDHEATPKLLHHSIHLPLRSTDWSLMRAEENVPINADICIGVTKPARPGLHCKYYYYWWLTVFFLCNFSCHWVANFKLHRCWKAQPAVPDMPVIHPVTFHSLHEGRACQREPMVLCTRNHEIVDVSGIWKTKNWRALTAPTALSASGTVPAQSWLSAPNLCTYASLSTCSIPRIEVTYGAGYKTAFDIACSTALPCLWDV